MEKLFLGISSNVVCINKHNGDIIWKTKLKSSTLTNVYYEQGQVFAYAGGHLYCLDSNSGDILWQNPLKGLGYGTCTIASAQANQTALAQDSQAQTAIAATIAATTAASSSS